MIYYRPTDGDVHFGPIKWRPQTCFLMTKLGQPIPSIVVEIREEIQRILTEVNYNLIDANSITTGKDFLYKIWQITLSVPVGIAIVSDDISHQTMANIFYELGWMQSFGKETLVIKTKGIEVPSDFVRTEYVEYNGDFQNRFRSFVDSLKENGDYYFKIALNIEKNPLLAIDYLKRAYLLTGNKNYVRYAIKIFSQAGLNNRAKNSVENLMMSFCKNNKAKVRIRKKRELINSKK